MTTSLWAFTRQVLKGFNANQGLLLAGAVAYYALISIVPMLILFVIASSHFVSEAELLATITRYVEWVVPGQSGAIVAALSSFLDNRDFIGGVLLVTIIFFSSLAFSVVEKAMSVIFLHRFATRRRHILVSIVMPYLYMALLGAGLVVVTYLASALERFDSDRVTVVALYAMGVVGEVVLFASIYLVMPVGRLPLRHALLGGVTATVLWEITRHILRWYFGSLSKVTDVYGPFAAAIVILLSFEFGAILLLLGAQVISEYEQLERRQPEPPPEPLRIDP